MDYDIYPCAEIGDQYKINYGLFKRLKKAYPQKDMSKFIYRPAYIVGKSILLSYKDYYKLQYEFENQRGYNGTSSNNNISDKLIDLIDRNRMVTV